MTNNSQKGQVSNIKRLTDIEMPRLTQKQKLLIQPQSQPQPQPQSQSQPQPQTQLAQMQELKVQDDIQQFFRFVAQPTDRLPTTILWISLGSCIGVTIRILLSVAGQAFYEQISTLLKFLGFSYFLANCVGCFIMGIFTQLKTSFQTHHKYLLTGITTGFCGSCTTLSSWMVDLSALFYVGYNWLNALLLIVIQFAVFLCAFYLGLHFAREINMNKMPATPEIPWWIGGIILVFYIAGGCLGAGFDEANRGQYIAVLFGPFGAVTRYLLGLYNRKDFPIGTFVANVVASLLITLLYLGNYSQSFDIWYYLFGMGGVGVGILGSLSTVSTWMNQIRSLSEDRLRAGYIYAITTVLFIQFMIAIIFGIWVRTGHHVV